MRLKTLGGLWVENGAHAAAAGPRPRALALLAVLAVAGQKGASRDRVLGVLWPESDPDRARHALAQTIYGLRKDLRADVVLSTPDLRLNPTLISSDVAELRTAIRDSDWRKAATLYDGPFLEGFYLADAPEFERWAESERASLSRDSIRAIEHLANEELAQGRRSDAAEWYRRLTRLDPVDPRFAIAYMETLAALGNRTEALAHGKAYTELLRREFDAAPDHDVKRVIEQLREMEDTDSFPVVAPPQPIPAVDTERRRLPARRTLLAATVGVALVATSLVAWRAIARTRQLPVVAVGRIRDLGSPDSIGLAGVLRDMLATNLGSVAELQVISNSRILELTPRNADSSSAIVTDAARRAGATEIIEGELLPLAGKSLRLNLRRVDMARGIVRGAYQISGTDRIALFDTVTALIARDFRLAAPTRSLADVSTRSPVAYRLYEDGLRAFYQFDAASSSRLFRSAMREDSSFAMAAYYAWRAAIALDDSDQVTLGRRALALSSHASERDGLLIRTHVGFRHHDPRAAAAAESLAARYPRDPEALIRAADVIPDLSRATDLLDQSIALDSASGTRPAAICRMCDALNLLAFRYHWADSIGAAERTLHRWIALRPADPQPWTVLGDLLIAIGRRDEAAAANRRAVALGATPANRITNLTASLRSDDFAAADSLCSEQLATAEAGSFDEFRWYCTILLRMEGRYREALALVRDGRLPHSSTIRRGALDDLYNEAILDLETGRALVAADEFRSLGASAADRSRTDPGVRARDVAWFLTLCATAAVAGGDTPRARALADTIQVVGRQSLYPRDPQLHHFVRGLLAARAHDAATATRELRASIVSPTFGYTRANYELGQVLRAQHRPVEAIPIVRAALRGGIDGSNLYITRTELHELLAQLFEASGEEDSASVHYAVVTRAWRSADPAFASRYDLARRSGKPK